LSAAICVDFICAICGILSKRALSTLQHFPFAGLEWFPQISRIECPQITQI
jgi:hypothetical protein